jgi:hypothetical protein
MFWLEMSEIDFTNLGILPNEALLNRITSSLNEIYALGNLELHAAWLYFGGIKAAAKALNITPQLLHQALQRRVRPTYKGLSEEVREDIWDARAVILEMADDERTAACTFHSMPREQFISQLQASQAARDSNQLPQTVHHSIRLLDGYSRLWKYRRAPKVLFQASGFTRPAQALLKSRTLTEERGLDSKVCLVALDILKEYETYLWHRQAVAAHIKVQRGIQSRNRTKLYDALVLRDGKACAYCKSKRRLLIDHIKPLVRGGLTDMCNLQLLCFSCNSKKSDTFREAKT